MSKQSSREEELATSIDKTRKQVTILFTDIVDSSRYWDQFGDIKGRMMVDRHNRLAFPVIAKFHGRIVKTIGDGLMAEFRRPDNALFAAIGIQQILQKMRDADRSFSAKVRIGLHTGVAIVEKHDVYGDAVNVAKRVEGFAEKNEICLSEHTSELINKKNHSSHKKGSFTPKGKRSPLTIYRCRWNEYRDLTRGLKLNTDFPLDARGKGDLIAYSTMAFICFAALYLIYFRYILAASSHPEADLTMQTALLNPWLVFHMYPFLGAFLTAVFLFLILVLIWLRTIPHIVLRILKGISGFGLGFALIYLPVSFFNIGLGTGESQAIVKSELQFIRAPYSMLSKLKEPDIPYKNIYSFFEWDVVLPARKSFLSERQTAEFWHNTNNKNTEVVGVWRKTNLSLQQSNPFYFRILDLCAIALGLVGFVSGFLNFSISPR